MPTPKPMADEQLVGMSKAELAEILDSVFDQASSSSGQAPAFSEIPSLAGALGEIDRVLDGDDRPSTLRYTGLVFHAEAWTSRHTNSFVLVLREIARSVWFVPLSHVREFSEHTPGPLVRGLEWPELEDVAPAMRAARRSLNTRRGLKVAADATGSGRHTFCEGGATYSEWDGRAKGFDWLGD